MHEPEEVADVIFHETLISLMAHTIRGAQNYFLKAGVELDLRLLWDEDGSIVSAGGSESPSFLVTHPTGRSSSDKINRIKAKIFIHGDANIHLARYCVAHELYHILLELWKFQSTDRRKWTNIPITEEMEKNCDLFGWNLCHKHHTFHSDDGIRKNKLKFPDDAVLKPFSIKDKKHWPKGIALDPENSFFKKN